MLKEKSFDEVKASLIKTSKELLEKLNELKRDYPEDCCEETDEMIERLELALKIFNELKDD